MATPQGTAWRSRWAAPPRHVHDSETRPFFVGMHEQPVFQRMGLFAGESYPVASRIARRGLYLPSGLALTESQLAAVSDAVHEVFAQ